MSVGKPRRVRLHSEESWISSARKVSCWNRFHGKLIDRLVSSRTQGHDDCDRTGTSRHGSTRMSRRNSCPPPAPEKMSVDTLHCSTRWEKHQIWAAGSTHQNTRHFLQCKLNSLMRHTATTSSGCRTLRSTSFLGRARIVFSEP